LTSARASLAVLASLALVACHQPAAHGTCQVHTSTQGVSVNGTSLDSHGTPRLVMRAATLLQASSLLSPLALKGTLAAASEAQAQQPPPVWCSNQQSDHSKTEGAKHSCALALALLLAATAGAQGVPFLHCALARLATVAIKTLKVSRALLGLLRPVVRKGALEAFRDFFSLV